MQVRVYYEDTDAEGVVYHANYLNFMERARSEWCRTLGVQLSDLAEEGILTAVRAAHLEYLRPAQLDDLLEVVDSKYKLAYIAAKRAKIIKKDEYSAVDNKCQKPVGKALEEILAKKVTAKF